MSLVDFDGTIPSDAVQGDLIGSIDLRESITKRLVFIARDLAYSSAIGDPPQIAKFWGKISLYRNGMSLKFNPLRYDPEFDIPIRPTDKVRHLSVFGSLIQTSKGFIQSGNLSVSPRPLDVALEVDVMGYFKFTHQHGARYSVQFRAVQELLG